MSAGRLPGGGFGGFLARFLGHTPSFRRFQRINHWGIEASWNRAGRQVSLMASQQAYKEFDAPPIRSLNAIPERSILDTILDTILGSDDEQGY